MTYQSTGSGTNHWNYMELPENAYLRMLYRNNSVNKSYLFLKSNVTRKTNNLPFFLLLCSPMYEKEAAL